ncbi:F-box/LRR-repeat protein 7 [Fasciola gigantica]|uniref:F-box/LRR-repeat protein 7 n=1 Tax=Fasciola gigantica TaxID=46835 RepID=A0A504YDG2_FASGI|nr:F-box/LRR-repeat protein 7 [Fasciola gigantica]
MEESESFLYPYSSFGLCATDLGTEQPYMVYDTSSQVPLNGYSGCSPQMEPVFSMCSELPRDSMTASDKGKQTSNPELTSQGFCPRCGISATDAGNWCSSCGELLIGASLCSSELSDWNTTGVSFKPLQMAHTEPVNFAPELLRFSFGNNGAYLQSYSVDGKHDLFDDNQKFYHHAASTIATEPPIAAASFASTSSLTIPHTQTQWVEENIANAVTVEQNTQAFHVAETSLPPASQVESLQSAFEELQLKNKPSVSLGALQFMNSVKSQYTTPCLKTVHTGSPRTASSHPKPTDFFNAVYAAYCHTPSKFDCSPVARVMQQFSAGRQRCISGPVRNNPFPTEGALTSEFRHFEYPFFPPPIGGAQRSFDSPAQGTFCLADSWPNSSSPFGPPAFASIAPSSSLKPEMFPIADSVPSKISSYNSVPALRRDLCKKDGTRRATSRQRQKHASGCSNPRPIPLAIQKQSPFRPRSSSSDLRNTELNCANLMPTIDRPPQCFWPSSRIAWSAHDPASLKKKSASYLRASFSHGFNTPSNCQDPFRSCAIDRSDTNAPTFSVRPVSRSAQPKLRDEHVARQEHGPDRLSNPVARNSRVPGSPFTRVEKRPRKGRPEKNLNRRRTNANLTRPRHKTRDSSTQEDVLGKISAQPNAASARASTRKNWSHPPTTDSGLGLPDWMSLPDELWLCVIRLLPTVDRGRFAQVCRRLASLTLDRSLWHVIQLHRHQHLTDIALASIGRLRPRELRLTYCRGDTVGEKGLRLMFQGCGTGLRKLSFIGCTKGPFDQDLPLVLAAEYCPNLSHVNASYTQAVRDQTVIALAKSAFHLISVKLNGAQQISNVAIQQLVHYHKDTLQRLELFGCFRLNSDIFKLLGRCQELRALAFGHLHHLSSDGLLELVGKLPHLASLDLRGTQTLGNDTNLTCLADKCPHLEEVVLANMHSLKGEAGIAQMLRRLPRLRVLDLCGLSAVGDLTMEALAKSCPHLEELDVSCTSVTRTGLLHLAQVPAECLRCLRISHCREITKEVLEKLIKACPKLTLLYAYGFNSIKDWGFLQAIRPALLVENDT